MIQKKVEKRVKRTLTSKTQLDPPGKKGIGEIYPWYPTESPELPPLTKR